MKSICHSADQNPFYLYVIQLDQTPNPHLSRCYPAYSKSPFSSAGCLDQRIDPDPAIWRQTLETRRQTLRPPCELTVSWYISHVSIHVLTRQLPCVNTIAHVCFYINRCVFVRGVCSRVSIKTRSKTQKNTTPTPSLTVKLLILSSQAMCQITLTNAFTLVFSRLSKQMLSCQLTRARMHRPPQKRYSEGVNCLAS